MGGRGISEDKGEKFGRRRSRCGVSLADAVCPWQSTSMV